MITFLQQDPLHDLPALQTPMAIAPAGRDWWDYTWANVGRFLLMDTWAGQGANWTWNNGQDVARIGFGVVDVGVGIGIFWTGVGTLPGWL